MDAPQSAMLLRIFTEEGRSHEHRPLYEWIVLKARELKLAGATVLRGPMGYGMHAQLHTAKILDLSGKLPLVIEIIDEEPKIRDFVAQLEPIKQLGLVTLERVEVVHYGSDPASKPA
jgi:PII-like signaling protein